MKKLFLFAATLLTSLSMMAGTLFSFTVTSSTTATGSYADGAAVLSGSAMSTGGTNELTVGDQTFYKFNSSSTWTFNLDDELQADDVITLTVAANASSKKSNKGVIINGFTMTASSIPAGGTATITYTVASNDSLVGKSTLVMTRADSDIKFGTIVIDGNHTPVTKYTVSYYDGANLLGTEKVKDGEYPIDYTKYQSKTHSTFNGWYNEAALTSAANMSAAITADKAFYGKWTLQGFTASTSINIEQGVLDNGKKWDVAAALTAAHIAFADIDALDSLNSSKDNNNEPYLGLKLKTAGAYVEMGVPAGNTLKVKFGAVGADIKVNGTTVAKADVENNIYSYTASADEFVKVETTTGGTVVLKQIFVGVPTASANLTGIKVNGNAISGFRADSLNYAYALPYGTTKMPVITVTKEDEDATVTIDSITSLTQNVSIAVVSGTQNKTYTVQLSIAGAPKAVYEAVFSNGVKAAIYSDKLDVPYMGAVPSLVSDSVSAGATAALNGNTLTVTGADNTTKAYTVNFIELTAPAMLTDTVTFTGEETYIYAHYGWDSGKGWKFAKAVNDASNMRITEGKTRIYMALPACSKLHLISGSAGGRTVKIYVNGNLSEVNKTAKSDEAITLDLNTVDANFVAIESNQDGGDGGFTRMLLSNEIVTSLDQVETTKAIKVIENGQIIIIKNGVRYNAVGARL